jgi:hypothetical protein
MEPKIKSLIENLLAKTKKKETKWDRIGKGDRFILFLDSAKITMDKVISTKGNLFYQFSIINANGDTILNINETKDTSNYSVLRNEEYDLLKELHGEIKKVYFKVEETIEGLLGEVNKDGEIGKDDPDNLPF